MANYKEKTTGFGSGRYYAMTLCRKYLDGWSAYPNAPADVHSLGDIVEFQLLGPAQFCQQRQVDCVSCPRSHAFLSNGQGPLFDLIRLASTILSWLSGRKYANAIDSSGISPNPVIKHRLINKHARIFEVNPIKNTPDAS